MRNFSSSEKMAIISSLAQRPVNGLTYRLLSVICWSRLSCFQFCFRPAGNLYAEFFNGCQLEADTEQLMKTDVTQPCVYAVDLACAYALKERGIMADAVAGYSLGELAALTFAGSLTPEEGVRLVAARGAAMQRASELQETGMMAVLKLDSKTVSDLASEFDGLYAVNYNCPGQVVVSGLKSRMPQFCEKAAQAGGRCVPLAVSAAFHSPFMNKAADGFSEELKKYDIKAPEIPVYSNLTAQPYEESVSDVLGNQMKSPVRWQETIENMIKDGYTDFIEVGAGKTLSGLIKKISKEVRVSSVEDKDSLEKTLASF